MPPNFDSTQFFVGLIIILLSISLHEFGHAKSADAAGDPTPRNQGRVTLNPLAHLDPMGTIMILVTTLTGFGIGWGRPVMVRPDRMQNPRWDHFMSVLWGPLTNLILAIVFAAFYRLSNGDPTIAMIGTMGCFINIGLCMFNLLPLGPLDGHWLLGILLPPKIGQPFMQWSKAQGTMLLFIIIIADQTIFRNDVGVLDILLFRPATFLARMMLIGTP